MHLSPWEPLSSDAQEVEGNRLGLLSPAPTLQCFSPHPSNLKDQVEQSTGGELAVPCRGAWQRPICP